MTVTTAEQDTGRLIRWDRQARRNAWDVDTMTAIADAIEAAGAEPEVRSIVLRGAGDHFSAGDDLRSALEADAAAWEATMAGFQRLTRVVLAAPVPVIAAVDGVCVGGALEFAASCDLRLCTDRITLITPEVGIGLVASNAGTLLLPEVLGESGARELLLSGEPRDAAWAREHGFATELVSPGELDERIAHWIGVFSRSSRAAVAATKAMLNERFGTLLAEAMDRETHHAVRLFGEPDARAALRSSPSAAPSRRRGPAPTRRSRSAGAPAEPASAPRTSTSLPAGAASTSTPRSLGEIRRSATRATAGSPTSSRRAVDTSKLSVGDQVAAVSGIVLLVVMFLPWYGVDVNVAGFSASTSVTAWESMSFIDILLFLAALVAIGVPVARATGSLPDDMPGSLLILAAGGIALLLALFRLIDIPAPDVPAAAESSVDFGRKIGLFLGVLATAGITYGGWRANEEETVGSTPAPAPPAA